MPKLKKEKAKILIVEDDASIIDIYTLQLDAEGFRVCTAANGEEGLKMCATEKPDLILLDILMPTMDGFTMLQKLRAQDGYGKTVPVILLTNLSASNEDVIKKIAETEPLNYIVKSSMTPKEVLKKIEEHLAGMKK